MSLFGSLFGSGTRQLNRSAAEADRRLTQGRDDAMRYLTQGRDTARTDMTRGFTDAQGAYDRAMPGIRTDITTGFNSANDTLRQGYGSAEEAINQGTTQAQSYLNPYHQSGLRSQALYDTAMGTGTGGAQGARDFYANFDRDGLIIDVRRNNGGNIDSWIIEKLLRKAWAFWSSAATSPRAKRWKKSCAAHATWRRKPRASSPIFWPT